MRQFDKLQIIIIFLSIAIVLALGYFVYSVYTGKIGKAAVSVDVAYGKANVLINDKPNGETPVYTEDVLAGEIKVTINGENSSYTALIKPSSKTRAVIKRDLGVSEVFSSGQNIYFEKISGDESFISVTSPSTEDVSVIVDGVEVGKTPVKFSTKTLLNPSEDDKYKLTFSKKGYETQEVIINTKPEYVVNFRVDMFLNPLPESVTILDGLPEGVKFINFSSSSGAAFENKKDWAKAINYYLKTRGESTFGDVKRDKFDFFIANDGKIYDAEGSEIAATDLKYDAGTFVAYLGSSNETNLSDEAKNTIAIATGKAPTGQETPSGDGAMVKIKPTPTNYLRVRAEASTSAAELGKLDIGVTVPFIEEKSGWYKVEYEAGKQGWISALYATKVNE